MSAHDGVPISGRDPANTISLSNPRLTSSAFSIDVDSSGSGNAHIFLWKGDEGQIPVYNTSCPFTPTPDYGLSACALTDGGIPPWSPDMSGRVVRDVKVAVTAGKRTISIPLDAAAYAKLSTGSSALISFEKPSNTVQAFDVDLAPTGDVGGTVPATLSLVLGPAASFGAFTPGLGKDYTAATTATVTSTAGDATLSVSDPGHLINGSFSLPQPLQVTLSKTAWSGPVSNDVVDVAFKQRIDANDA